MNVWPIWAVNVNLPPSRRFKQDELLLFALWVGRDKPNMTSFLYQFVQEDLKKQSQNSFKLVDDDGNERKCRVKLLGVTADLPARVCPGSPLTPMHEI